MKPKTMILMGLAVTCGLGASYMTSQLLASRSPTEEQKVDIIVAKKQLNVGEMIRKPEDLFTTKTFVLGQEPKDALQQKDLESLKGKIMKQSLRPQDHVTPNDLSAEGGLQIPEGHYALGFPVNGVTSASGFASLPLSRVDIILTMKRGDDKASKSKVLLSNVLVLAADMTVGREQGIAAPASVVTFALKPEEALQMQLAQTMGSLTLALRKQNDKSVVHTREVNGESIMNDKKDSDSSEGDVPRKHVAPPVLAAKLPSADEFPKAVAKDTTEAPAPAEEAKLFSHKLVILNGARSETHTYQLTEDGRPAGVEEGNAPTPPRRPQALPKKTVPPSDL